MSLWKYNGHDTRAREREGEREGGRERGRERRGKARRSKLTLEAVNRLAIVFLILFSVISMCLTSDEERDASSMTGCGALTAVLPLFKSSRYFNTSLN